MPGDPAPFPKSTKLADNTRPGVWIYHKQYTVPSEYLQMLMVK